MILGAISPANSLSQVNFEEGSPEGAANPLANGIKATLASNSLRVVRGQTVEISLTIFNGGESRSVFDPFLDPLLPNPICIAVFDERKNYLGNVLETFSGSQRGARDKDWILLPHNGIVGLKLVRRVDLLPTSIGENTQLPAGHYYIQAVCFEGMFAAPKVSGVGTAGQQRIDQSPILRSNLLIIEIVP